MREVPHAVGGADLFDNRREGGVVDVADLGEQVMLDLEVETTQVPGEELVIAPEVDGGLDLMRGPFMLDLAGGDARLPEGRLLDTVGELEHRRQGQPEDEAGEEVEEDHRVNAVAGGRQVERPDIENELAPPEGHLLPTLGTWHTRVGDTRLHEGAEIARDLPFDRQKRIKDPHVQMLKAVKAVPLVVGRESTERAHVEVVVGARDVGVGV